MPENESYFRKTAIITKDKRMLYVYPSLATHIGFNETLVAHLLYQLIY